MVAVAQVVFNRVANPGWWGHTVAEVVLKPKQFSCWNDGDPVRKFVLSTPEESHRYVIADAAITVALLGEDVARGSTSYYNPQTVTPSWESSFEECVVIGHHRFGVVR